jgi:small neutral amino acid transporter SnatA (MarC family)
MHRLKRWLQPFLDNVKVIETSLIALSLWWAFILVLPLTTFDSSPSYAAMAKIAKEEVWSLVFFVLAAMKLYGMIFEKFRIRIVAHSISAGLWLFVAAMFAVGNIATTATGTYFIVFCLTSYVCYKVGEQRGD